MVRKASGHSQPERVSALRAPRAETLRRIFGKPIGVGLGHALRCSAGRVGVAVLFHRVGDPQGDPERELVPALGTHLFAAQIRHLATVYSIVDASDLHRAVAARRRWQRFPAAITFDDDLASHAEVALAKVGDSDVTATFFLCGASLYEPFAFWWERVQQAADASSDGLLAIPQSEKSDAGQRSDIHSVARQLEVLSRREREEFVTMLVGESSRTDADAGLRSDAVKRIVDAKCSIGFHTLRHDRLPALDDEELSAALREGRAELSEVAGAPLTVISYPHGRADGRVAARARNAGFEAGFTSVPSAVTSCTDPLLMGRIEPSFISVGHFAVQLAYHLLTGLRSVVRPNAFGAEHVRAL